jgi:hypothetical protein
MSNKSTILKITNKHISNFILNNQKQQKKQEKFQEEVEREEEEGDQIFRH